MELCVFNINGRESDSKVSSSCQLSLTASQISVWSGAQSSSARITCFYTVKNGQNQLSSSQSNPATVTVQTLHTLTAHPEAQQPKPGGLLIILVSTVGVILVGFIGLICLCWFAYKNRRKNNKRSSVKPDVLSQGNGVSCSGTAVLYSLITSAPATSQPISKDLEHPVSHQHNTADPENTFVTSVNPMYQTSAVSVPKQHKSDNTEENENVYHLYCTIADKPVHSNK
ncbi:uncharacterized protein [Danio rerio]|uniref:Uncharacterized protein n=1 Tax=Danio rerio TaxID=7955 RepID=A0AC58GUD0_DANRE